MKSKFEYKIKRHILFCSYEKLWITLTILMLVSVFVIIRGSTAELIIDNQITRFLFCSDVNGDKTLYNIALGNFSAYIFYILQVYIPERKKTRRALESMVLDVYNLINQTMMFLFVWDKLTEKTSDGAIMGIKHKRFYFIDKRYGEIAHEADVDELKKIAVRVREEYEKVINSTYINTVDENIYVLLKEMNISDEVNSLLILMLSGDVASNTCATIYETYSPDDVKLIKSKMVVLKDLFGFNDIGEFEETKDSEAIKRWNDQKVMMVAMIAENMDYFTNLPKDYSDAIK